MNQSKAFVDSWLRHRLVVIEILEKFTDEQLEYKPWDKGMTLKQLVLHIVESAKFFVNTVKEGKLSKNPERKAEINSIDELRQYTQELTEETKNHLTELSDEHFQNLVDVSAMFGTNLPGSALLQLMRDHEIHHKGQLMVYARLLGIESLPLFIKRDL
jgi:uncharacterized damage-inducible protein DinB